MEINGGLDHTGPLFSMEFDLLRLACSRPRVLCDKNPDALSEALDMFPLLHQHGDRAVELPAPSGIGRLGSGEAHDRSSLRFDMVGADALVGERALSHHVGKGIDMPAGLPDRGMHDDRGVEADDVIAVARHGAPPGVAQISLQLGTQRAVVPEAADAAVDFRGLEDKASALAEADDLLHAGIMCWCGGHSKGFLD